MDEPWTLPELAAEAARLLSGDRSARPGGRARELPNERMIRWYATIGLMDPPLRRRGRVALYGTRHLLQLLAVKRRQAEGRSLTEIQAELTGATDATLREIARTPGRAGAGVSGFGRGDGTGGTERDVPAAPLPFWARRPAADAGDRAGAAAGTERFAEPAAGPPTGPSARIAGDAAAESTAGAGGGTGAGRVPPEALVSAVRLTSGATLLLPSLAAPEDAAAIIAAAEPLIDLLTERGLG